MSPSSSAKVWQCTRIDTRRRKAQQLQTIQFIDYRRYGTGTLYGQGPTRSRIFADVPHRLYKYNKDIAKRSKCLLITYVVLSVVPIPIPYAGIACTTRRPTEIVWKIRYLYEGLRNSLHDETLTHTVLAWESQAMIMTRCCWGGSPRR